MTQKDPDHAAPSDESKAPPNPVLRNALRYSLSEKEYDALHRYLLSRAPSIIHRKIPSPQRYRSTVHDSDDFNAATVRASLRVFLASQTGLQLWEWISSRVLARNKPQRKANTSTLKSANFRLSLSASLILLLHRFLYRFFSRLRTNLLSKSAAPFRRRNSRISRSLTSRLAPAIGASLAGFALGVCPSDQLRITIAIYVATRSLEYLYNALEIDGWFRDRPWWVGSWMLMPLATGQLLYAFVFDRDCFAKAYGDFILDHTPNYVQTRPPSYPSALPWPTTNQIVDSLAEMSRLNWPPFVSPILFPSLPTTLPPTLSVLSPITSPANPSHTALSCATLHPNDPSCIRTFTQYSLTAFPAMARFFTAIYALMMVPRYRKVFADPGSELGKLARRVLKTSTFITGAIGTSWASICLFQAILPRTFLPSARWFWGGFLGGLWAFVDRQGGRAQVLYSVRMSVDSVWKVGRKKGWWKGLKGGDVMVFVIGLALVNSIFELRREAIDGPVGRGLGWLRGEALLVKTDKRRLEEHDERKAT